MYVPDKHMSETVEDAMQEEGKKVLKEHDRPPHQGPTIKIVINMGSQPSHRPAPMPLKKKHKEKHNTHKPEHRGPVEEALRTAY